jgi:hypothetical protein
VPQGHTTDVVTTHTDLAPTFLRLIGAPLRADFDGEGIPTSKPELDYAVFKRHEHVNVEYWGFALGEGKDWDGGNVSVIRLETQLTLEQLAFTITTLIKLYALSRNPIICTIRYGATMSTSFTIFK